MNRLIDIISDIVVGAIAIFILLCYFGMAIVVLISFIYDIMRF